MLAVCGNKILFFSPLSCKKSTAFPPFHMEKGKGGEEEEVVGEEEEKERRADVLKT